MRQAIPGKLLCRCGKPLDRFDLMGTPQRAAAHADKPGGTAGAAVAHPIQATAAEAYRWRWDCKRCGSRVILRQSSIAEAFNKAALEDRSTIVVDVDV